MPYKPQWEVGDLFCHTLTFPQAALLGIDGWTILFYKVGEYLNCTGKHIQLMYVSLCAPGKEPVTGAELNDIGFLRMMRHDNTWDYMVQMKIKSKRDELNYGLTKIGHFNDVTLPADRTEENPLVAMPFFGRLRKDDAYPSYEDQVCRLYRAFGKKALGK